MKQDSKTDRLVAFALALAVAVIVMFMTSKIARSEVTYCRDDPGPGKWVYRVVDRHKCWFEARGLRRGREKPLNELAWPSYTSPPAMEITEPMRVPWEQEGRFRGEGAKPGWDHHE